MVVGVAAGVGAVDGFLIAIVLLVAVVAFVRCVLVRVGGVGIVLSGGVGEAVGVVCRKPTTAYLAFALEPAILMDQLLNSPSGRERPRFYAPGSCETFQ